MADRVNRIPSALCLLALLMAVAGCPRTAPPRSSGSPGDAWVVFDVSEMGSGTPLSAYVWVDPHQDDFETLTGAADVRFEGFGKTGEGYVVAFGPNQDLTFVAWAPGHELTYTQTRLGRGENLVTIQLRRSEIEDERVPDVIRMDVLERLPTEKPRTGT